MMTGVPPEMQAMMAQFPMTPEMMFGGMGMMPDPSAFAAPGGFPPAGPPYGQPPAGPNPQSQFGGFGGYPPPSGQQPPQGQLQMPKFPAGQRMGSPARMGSPNA